MKPLGFGLLHLPEKGENKEIDLEATCALVDDFLSRGGRLFDTAYNYLDGKSEVAFRECVVKRYPRDAVEIEDKLPTWKVRSPEDCGRFMAEQMERCGVDYFDVYLLHWMNERNYERCLKHDIFGFMRRQKAEGKARKIGFSFHDSPEVLERVLREQPGLDCVLLQLNYLDWESDAVQARACYDVAVRYGVKVTVMEPVKGGTLSVLPPEAKELFDARRPELSPSQWAMRFVRALPGVGMVLSGMNGLEQLAENMAELPELEEDEGEIYTKVRTILESSYVIKCSTCGYCLSNCPMQIPIPRYFKLYNEYHAKPEDGWKMLPTYEGMAKGKGKASECLACGACQEHCPQGIRIIEWLKKVSEAFEK